MNAIVQTADCCQGTLISEMGQEQTS